MTRSQLPSATWLLLSKGSFSTWFSCSTIWLRYFIISVTCVSFCNQSISEWFTVIWKYFSLLDIYSKVHWNTVQTIRFSFEVNLLTLLMKKVFFKFICSLVTGTVALVFSAIGVLSSGIVISKFKPRARSLAIWNVFVGILSVLGMISYAYLGCTENENSVIINHPLP